ncbi:hypothetical protein [Aeromicrobium sp. CTD01-1L150]|uniref:hypothetical protein n=1 Tax=Aeromicrobium sp. CTD01-1L150 TaxID=3341830 RepID=UPI0035C2480D
MTTLPQHEDIDLPMVLEEVLASASQGRAAATRLRYARVHAHLLLFLDRVDVRGPLGLQVAAALEVERDVGREGAFFRRLGVHELLTCLPLFLGPGWLAVRTVERRAQVRFVALLLRRLEQVDGLEPRTRVRAIGVLREALAAVRAGRDVELDHGQ